MPDAITSTYSNETPGVREMGDTIFEDVDDIITNVTPHKTPLIAACKKRKAANTDFEWMEDELKKPTGANRAVEGADAVATTRKPPKRLNNFTQIFEDTFKISGTMGAVKTIGREDHGKYELEKSIKYLLTEMEYAFINNETKDAGDGSTGRLTMGLAGFLATNDVSFGSYAATNDFNETLLVQMAEACFNEGGEPSTLLVAPSQARKIAWWNGAGKITTNANQDDKTLVLAVLVLDTPFGRIKVTIDLFIAVDDQAGTKYSQVYLLDPSMCAVATLRSMKTEKLGKTGDNDKYQTLVEAGFIVRAEKAMAVCGKCATDYTSTAPSRG